MSVEVAINAARFCCVSVNHGLSRVISLKYLMELVAWLVVMDGRNRIVDGEKIVYP